MKILVTLTMLATFGIVAIAAYSEAGDDYVASVAYTGTQGCTAQLRPKARYAVRCTSDCYVRMQPAATADAGMSVNTNSMLLSAGKLYDTPTTYDQQYICAVQSSASGTMHVYLYRGPTE